MSDELGGLTGRGQATRLPATSAVRGRKTIRRGSNSLRLRKRRYWGR